MHLRGSAVCVAQPPERPGAHGEDLREDRERGLGLCPPRCRARRGWMRAAPPPTHLPRGAVRAGAPGFAGIRARRRRTPRCRARRSARARRTCRRGSARRSPSGGRGRPRRSPRPPSAISRSAEGMRRGQEGGAGVRDDRCPAEQPRAPAERLGGVDRAVDEEPRGRAVPLGEHLRAVDLDEAVAPAADKLVEPAERLPGTPSRSSRRPRRRGLSRRPGLPRPS